MRPGFCQRLLALGMGCMLLCAGPAWGLTPAEIGDLRAGQVVISAQTSILGGMVDACIIVPAPPRLVYALVADPLAMPSYSPGIVAARVLENRGDSKLVRMHVRVLGFMDEDHDMLSVCQPYTRVSWRQVRGRFEAQSGHWLVSGFDGGTLLTYHAEVAAGQAVPPFVVNWFLKNSVPDLLRKIRQRFGGR